jgi:Rrf2 family protein
MISTTSEYALRALVSLAEAGKGATVLGRDLAKQTSVPLNYLWKILAPLRRNGMVGGTRGIRGGYFLDRNADEIRLIDVVEQFEAVKRVDSCLLGQADGCSDENPCGAHDEWKHVCRVYEEFLSSKTIADLMRPASPDDGDERE